MATQTATILKAFKGKFSTWSAGERVKARFVRGNSYFIERLKWKSPNLPLMNQCGGVPRGALTFDPVTQKARKPIRKVSAKHAKALRVYHTLRIAFLQANPFCQCCPVRFPGMQANPSDQVHHKQGRGKLLNDVTKWLAVCFCCHTHITNNPEWAMERGLILSRLSK